MARKPFGVWFSLAIAIAVLGGWSGSKVGQKVALYRFRRLERREGNLPNDERARLQDILHQLQVLEISKTLALVEYSDQSLRRRLGVLEALEHESRAKDLKPVIDADIGIASAEIAVVEKQLGNAGDASRSMQAAREILGSLGWKDCSDEALEEAAKFELATFSFRTEREGNKK